MENIEIIPNTYDNGKTEFDLFFDGEFRRSFDSCGEAFDFAVDNYTPIPTNPKPPVYIPTPGEPTVDFLELLTA